MPIGADAVVGTAFVTYGPGGVLAYDELLAATLTWHRRRPRVTISDIWVDDPASVAGGRQLWGIPKDLADFEHRASTGRVGVRAARDRWTRGGARDVRVRTRPAGTVADADADGAAPRRGRARQPGPGRGRVAPRRTRWLFRDDGPLAFLAGRSPLVSVQLSDLAIVFGQRAT